MSHFYYISGGFADLNASGAQEEVKTMLIRVKYFIEMLEVTFTDSNKFNLFINNINNNV